MGIGLAINIMIRYRLVLIRYLSVQINTIKHNRYKQSVCLLGERVEVFCSMKCKQHLVLRLAVETFKTFQKCVKKYSYNIGLFSQ